MNGTSPDRPIPNQESQPRALEAASLEQADAMPGVQPGTAGGSGPEALRLRRQAVLLTVGCVSALLLSGVLGRADWAATAAWESRTARAAALAADAEVIAQLKGLPQQATEVGLPRADLLACAARAMQTANLASEALVSTLPQPPRRVPGRDYAEITHRLMFENVPLESLVRFCHALTADNPALRASALQLRPGSERRTWNADVSISYWILAPEQKR